MTISLQDLLAHLRAELPEQEGRLFGFAEKNLIGPKEQSLFDTPHDSWNNPNLKPGHSARFLKAISDLVASGKRHVDILTMERPSGLFFRALTRAFELIADANLPNVVTVRLLMGKVASPDIINIEEMLKEIVDRLNNRKGKLDFYVGQTRWEMASWNHAKVIAVDEARMMVGGHNMWADDYLDTEPVFDISMRVDGQLAAGAHSFAERLWDFVRKSNTIPGTHTFSHRLTPELKIEKNVTPGYRNFGPGAPAGSIPALWVTCPGWGIFFDRNNRRIVKDGNLLCFQKAMLEATSCRMSLQDIGSDKLTDFKDFEEHAYDGHPYRLIACQGFFFTLELIDAYAEFLARNATNRLHIVLTSPAKGGRDYSHLVPPSVIYNVISYRMWKNHKVSKQDGLKKLVNQLTLGSISFNNQNRWPNTNNPIRNHAKFWMLDGKLMYLGSGNFYPHVKRVLTDNRPGHHTEFGMLADLPPATAKTIADTYFDPMLKYSARVPPELTHLTWKES